MGNKYVTVFSGYSGPSMASGAPTPPSGTRWATRLSVLEKRWGTGRFARSRREQRGNGDGNQLRGSQHARQHREDQRPVVRLLPPPPRGFGFARQPMVAPIAVDWDEKPVAEGGTVRIRAYDPYAPDGTWARKAVTGTSIPVPKSLRKGSTSMASILTNTTRPDTPATSPISARSRTPGIYGTTICPSRR